MKLRYLADGSPDCPLIRLYDYKAGEVGHLMQFCRDLAEKRISEVPLHEQPWIEPIANCRLFWQFASKDLGVTWSSKRGAFLMEYSEEGWLEVNDKLKPFAGDSKGRNHFNWLTMEGEVKLLISPSGKW